MLGRHEFSQLQRCLPRSVNVFVEADPKLRPDRLAEAGCQHHLQQMFAEELRVLQVEEGEAFDERGDGHGVGLAEIQKLDEPLDLRLRERLMQLQERAGQGRERRRVGGVVVGGALLDVLRLEGSKEPQQERGKGFPWNVAELDCFRPMMEEEGGGHRVRVPNRPDVPILEVEHRRLNVGAACLDRDVGVEGDVELI